MSFNFNNTVRSYSQLNTIPALSGILFAVSAAIQFLGAEISLAIPSYTFDPNHALLVSLAVLVIAFASSETKDWRYYETWEQVTVGIAVVVMIGAEYTTTVAEFLTNNDPVAGMAAFLISMAAWSVLAR